MSETDDKFFFYNLEFFVFFTQVKRQCGPVGNVKGLVYAKICSLT